MKRSALLPSLVVVLSLVFVTGCSKKEESAASSALLESDLLKKIPDNSVGFVVWDSTTPAYQKFLASSWGKANTSMVSTIRSAMSTSNTPELEPLLDTLQKLGFDNSSEFSATAARGVAFVGIDAGAKKVDLGIFINSQSVALTDKLTTLETVFKEKGLATRAETVGGDRSYSIQLPAGPQNAALGDRLYFAATKDTLAISPSPAVSARAFTAPATDGSAALRSTAQYKRAVEAIDSTDPQFRFTYFDFAKIWTQLDQVIPAQAKANSEFQVTDIPVEALAGNATMGDQLAAILAVTFTPRNDKQKQWFAAFNNGGGAEAAKKLPSNSVFTLSLDGKMLLAVKDLVIETLPPEEQEMARMSAELLNGLNGIALAVRNAAGGSPFPELILAADIANPQQLAEMIKGQASGLLASGMPASPLQEKEIDGVKVNFMMSPLGVGAFLGVVDSSLVLASSEGAITDYVKSSRNKGARLADTLGTGAKKLLDKSEPFLAMQVDFTNGVTMAENLQSSLAMFTGGKTSVDQAMLDHLRKLGSCMTALAFRADTLKINSVYDSPTVVR